MNVLELVRKSTKKEQAVKQAQKQLCYCLFLLNEVIAPLFVFVDFRNVPAAFLVLKLSDLHLQFGRETYAVWILQ